MAAQRRTRRNTRSNQRLFAQDVYKNQPTNRRYGRSPETYRTYSGGSSEIQGFGRSGEDYPNYAFDYIDEQYRYFPGERTNEEYSRGQYTGRGPKNWRRSDENITEEANLWLTDDAWIDATNIEVSVKDGEVTLTGTVDTRQAKRYAEDIVSEISGVVEVHNRLRVAE